MIPAHILALLGLTLSGAPLQASAVPQADGEVIEASARHPAAARPMVLKARDRVRIAASFFAPSGEGRSPGAILIHSAGADRRRLDTLALALHKRGFGVLTLDLRGHGESATEEADWSLMNAEDRRIAWSFAERDVTAAAVWLASQPSIHASNLTLIGVGTGCTLALDQAVENRSVRSVVLIAPPTGSQACDLPGGLVDLGGLPCLVLAPRDAREDAEQLRAAGRQGNSGRDCVEVLVSPTETGAALEDKRLLSTLAKWVRDRSEDD